MDMETQKFYAGIGSRKTPAKIQDDMSILGHQLRALGWILRSGGARGGDKAFECLVKDRKEIFTANSEIPKKAFEIAAEVHPNWFRCSPYAKRLHARNVLQILGQNLDQPVKFVVCWTPDGCESHATRTKETGGTGQAIAIASLIDIPVYNLYNEGRQEELLLYIDEVSTPKISER